MYGYTIAYGLLVRLLHRWGFQIGGKFNLHNILISPLNDGHQFVLNMAGWYIVPLFMVEILNCMIRAFFKRKGWQIPEWIFFAGAVLIGMGGNFLAIMEYRTSWWLTVVRILYFAPFYAMGIFYKKILEKYQIKAACVCFGAGFDKELAKDPELFSRELERAVEIAYELGAKVVNHYCYHVAMGPEISFSELEKYYGRAIRKAKQRKIYLALENEAHDITQSPEGMKTIVEHMNSEYFKTNFDATNYYQAGYEGFPYAYEVLKEYIVHVHIKNGCFYHPEFGHEKQCRGGKMTGMFAGK